MLKYTLDCICLYQDNKHCMCMVVFFRVLLFLLFTIFVINNLDFSASVDIFGLIGTFLTGSINDKDLLMNDFVFECKDISNKAGDGLIVCLKKT